MMTVMSISPSVGLVAALIITLDAIRAILMGSETGFGLVLISAIAAIGAALNATFGHRNDTDTDNRS